MNNTEFIHNFGLTPIDLLQKAEAYTEKHTENLNVLQRMALRDHLIEFTKQLEKEKYHPSAPLRVRKSEINNPKS